MDRLLDIGRRHGIPVIEDAAEAIGSVWHGRRAGSMGTFGTFSFHGTKTLTTGEGGMFVTSDDGLFEKVLTLSNHGRARGQKKQFWPDDIGFKYKMSNIQAALGCAQLERIEALIARKREILASYADKAQSLSEHQPQPGKRRHGQRRLDADRRLRPRHRHHPRNAAAGVQRRQYRRARLLPSADQPADVFRDGASNRHAWDIPERAINLPSYHDMTEDEIDRVTDVIVGLIDSRAAGRNTLGEIRLNQRRLIRRLPHGLRQPF